MKHSRPIYIAALAAMFAASTVQAELIRFIWSGGGGGDGVNFADPMNWGGEASDGTNLPGDVVDAGAADASNVIMQTGGTSTTTVTAPFSPANPFDILIVRSGHTLGVSADFSLTGIPTLLGQTGTGSVLNHSAGTFTTANLTIGGGADGTYNLSGSGNLAATSVTINNNSTLSLSGASASLSSDNLSIDTGSTLDFFFGPSGLNPMGLSGAFNVTPGALLSVDGSNYTGGAGMIDLVAFGGNSGTFADPTDISFSGFSGLDAAIGYDSDSMFVALTAIPEPGSSVLFILGGVLLFLRRRL